VKMSEEMLNKSAQKLLRIIKTPNAKDNVYPKKGIERSALMDRVGGRSREKENEREDYMKKLFMKPAFHS